MTGSLPRRLLDDADAYALDALGDADRRAVEAERHRVDAATRARFDAMVRDIRETVALASVVDAVPVPDRLRDLVLDLVATSDQDSRVRELPTGTSGAAPSRRAHSKTWRYSMVSAAAAVIVAVGGVVIVTQNADNGLPPSRAGEIAAAPDSREVSAELPGGGSATVSFSSSVDAVVVSMDGVSEPPAGTVYQMWFVDGSPRSAGVMTDAQLTSKSGTVVDGLGASTNFAISLEPLGGSPMPTDVLAMLPLRF